MENIRNLEKMTDAAILLGVRGSCPVDGSEFSRYGGATASVLLRLGGECIVLDGGTGILNIGNFLHKDQRELHILLSHPHFDHLMGLVICPIFFNAAYRVELYAACHEGRSIREQIEALMAPPLWPVGFETFRAAVAFHDLENDCFQIGSVFVETLEGNHPGGSTIFRLSKGDKSVVYASDFECTRESEGLLTSFAKDCTLFICDAQYSDEELKQKHGFGHSSWNDAVRIGKNCGAARIVMFHHDPFRTDEELDLMQRQIWKKHANATFAKCGEVIEL